MVVLHVHIVVIRVITIPGPIRIVIVVVHHAGVVPGVVPTTAPATVIITPAAAPASVPAPTRAVITRVPGVPGIPAVHAAPAAIRPIIIKSCHVNT